DRHLIGGAADAAGAHFDRRHHVVQRLLEYRKRILLGLAFDDVERAVDDPFRGRLLAVVHDRIHELGDDDVAELRVRHDLALFCGMATGHNADPYFGRLAPYFERRCLRFLTPWVSRTPRRMW